MRAIHVLQHAATEGPARLGALARSMGFAIVHHALWEGDPVPTTIPEDALVVVLGGSMSVADAGDARWPFLQAEIDLLGRLLPAGQPVLGICLGAQLMARALGARVAPLRVGEPPTLHREVGWGAVTFTATPDVEPSLAGLNASEAVLHWHGDTFDLPKGATLLASTLACRQQMFRYGRRAFGIQFHPEVDTDDVSAWVSDDAAFIRAANGLTGAARILDDTARYMPRHRPVGDRLLRNVLEAMIG